MVRSGYRHLEPFHVPVGRTLATDQGNGHSIKEQSRIVRFHVTLEPYA